ncbi:MAG: hypothetical protein M1838_004091 [Thelocarpon superellum]|nr:MAG: hypothetical protein M1838_004091 [Thelocarpon superellum]
MGSSYFYLEFLLVWVALLQANGFRNPAIFALEYTLAPEAVYPQQLHEALAGYDFVLSKTDRPERICLSGDSAGGTLILSLLLHLAHAPERSQQRPGFATLISPWVTLESPRNQDTSSDFLNVQSLQLYARQYVGPKASLFDPIVSPGTCQDLGWWARAAPTKGLMVLYGAEEVFAPDCRSLVARLRRAGAKVVAREEDGSVHAWPVANLFLGQSGAERQKGISDIAAVTWDRMGADGEEHVCSQ